MDAREELLALRRMAELEAKAGGTPGGTPAEKSSGVDQFVGGLKNFVGKNSVMAFAEHAANIGASIMQPFQALQDKVSGTTGTNAATRAGIKGGVDEIGVDRNSLEYKNAGLLTDIAGTAGLGGLLAKPIAAAVPYLRAALPSVAPYVDKFANALSSSGFTTGGAAPTNLLAKSGEIGIRMAGGAATGAASAGVIDPSSAGAGAIIGAALPPALKAVGAAAAPVARALKDVSMPSNVAGAQAMIKALDLSAPELQAVMAATKSVPADLVPGSQLTFAQALQLKGANTPGVKMLERTVSGGPGGDVLLKRYEDQGVARLAALQAEGAQNYQGAAAEEATKVGDKLGAILRTQAGDDQAATRMAWESLNRRATRDGVAVHLPLDEMADAMRPLGRGSVGVGKDANAVLKTANEIGTDTLPATLPTTARVGENTADKTLGQAVRAIGIHPDELRVGVMGGEVRWLRESLSGGRGLVNKNGQSLDRLAEKMHAAGYLDHPEPSELLQKLTAEAQGAPIYSNGVNGGRLQYLAQGADVPARAGSITPKAVPFDEFQRLRRDSGALGAKAAEDASRGAESKVLYDFENALSSRMDQAASGNLLAGERVPAGFGEQYNAARAMTRADKERYAQGNAIGSILRKPVGQDYKLTGDEITNKLWHGGAGLAGDVSNLKNVLSDNNREPALNALRSFVMTDAASKTTAGGNLASAFPRYVESRFPGLQEAMTPSQMNALSSVASDIRNSEAAASVTGLRGSDTQAKITRALDAGLLDSPAAKMVARFASLKGMGGETIRAKLADMMMQNKGKTIAELLANPNKAAEALEAYQRYQGGARNDLADMVGSAVYRGAPRSVANQP